MDVKFSTCFRAWFLLPSVIPLLMGGASCTRKAAETPLATTASVEEVAENPSAFTGKSVTLYGEVEETFGSRSFRLGGQDFFDKEILVFTRAPLSASVQRTADAPLTRDDLALVTGTVRTVTVAEIERELGFDLQPEYEVELENKLAIIADSVKISPRRAATGDFASATGTGSPASEGDIITDINAFLSNPDPSALVGRRVELNNVPVQTVVGDQSFMVGPSPAEEVFVTFEETATPGQAREGRIDVNAGQRVNLTGEVQRMPEPADAFLKRNSIDEATARKLREQPVYIQAKSVTLADRAG